MSPSATTPSSTAAPSKPAASSAWAPSSSTAPSSDPVPSSPPALSSPKKPSSSHIPSGWALPENSAVASMKPTRQPSSAMPRITWATRSCTCWRGRTLSLVRLPGPPLGGGCVGSWGEAGQFRVTTQDCNCSLYTAPGLFLRVTTITILRDQATPDCDGGHRQDGHPPLRLRAKLIHKTTQEKHSWLT